MSIEKSNSSDQEEVNHGQRVIDALYKQSYAIEAKGTELNPDKTESPFTSADNAFMNAYNRSVEAFLKKIYLKTMQINSSLPLKPLM